jgi:alkaline phosphatase
MGPDVRRDDEVKDGILFLSTPEGFSMRLSLLAAIFLAGCATPPAPVASSTTAPIDRARNVIFMVGSGMGINTLTAARIYAVGEEGDLTIDTLPESAFVKTYSKDAQATDSAAAMAAYMTGAKASNGDSCAPGATLAQLASARGRAIGIVTTGRSAASTCIGVPDAMTFDAGRERALAETTRAAIADLSRRPNGFFLVVENANIDRALHASLAKRALQETVAFDDALKAAITQMQLADPGLKNTLIVATADHDNSLLINGYSPRTGKTTPTNPGVLGLVRNVGDNKLRLDKDGMPYSILGFGNGEHRVNGSRATAPVLTDAMTSADDYRQEATVRMPAGGGTNSGNDVYLGAIGAGADTFYGTIDNTRVFGLIKATAGW